MWAMRRHIVTPTPSECHVSIAFVFSIKQTLCHDYIYLVLLRPKVC